MMVEADLHGSGTASRSDEPTGHNEGDIHRGYADRRPPRRALITGAKGFTGRYLADELSAHGWEVWGLGAHPDASDPHYRCVDLDDAQTLDAVLAEVQPDAVVHLAAIAFVGHGNVDDFYRVNVLGTRNLLDGLAALKDKAPSCVLLASSANVYGNAQGGVLTEDTPPHRRTTTRSASWRWSTWRGSSWTSCRSRSCGRSTTPASASPPISCCRRSSRISRTERRIELGNLDVWRDFSDVRVVVEAIGACWTLPPQGKCSMSVRVEPIHCARSWRQHGS